MKIIFKQKDEQHIDIVSVEEIKGSKSELYKRIGQIFSPGGSGEISRDCIQICGFEEAFDFWGCADFAEKTDKGITQKKDIQLQFKSYENVSDKRMIQITECPRCYNNPCTCENRIQGQSPYIVKREKDVNTERKEWQTTEE